MRINKPATPERTHEGAVASHISPEQQLRRTVMACLLWEKTFYEEGEDAVTRIKTLVPLCRPYAVADMAVEAREKMKLRHVPLLMVREMARHKTHRSLVGSTLERIIQRPDELAEFLAIYWKDGREKLAKQVKIGLAKAFTKFDEYRLAKYNREGAVKLRDVLFLVHAKPKDKKQASLWKRLVDGKLKTPGTWEVQLSAGKDKKKTWERLIKEGNLGALAFLRNLRNMEQVGVDPKIIERGFDEMKTERVLPFRFIAAARHAPKWEPQLEAAMFKCLEGQNKLKGKTVLVIDNSGSMHGASISEKSEMDRSDAACALAILLREVCEKVIVIAFAENPMLIPARRGFALADLIKSSPSDGTNTDFALQATEREGYDRIIVVTDEQSHQSIRAPNGIGYFVNVATYKNGIGYGKWTHIDGWSEAILSYIQEAEGK